MGMSKLTFVLRSPKGRNYGNHAVNWVGALSQSLINITLILCSGVT